MLRPVSHCPLYEPAKRVLGATLLERCMMSCTVCWSAPAFLRPACSTQPSLEQGRGHEKCEPLFGDETLVAPLASFVHNLLLISDSKRL